MMSTLTTGGSAHAADAASFTSGQLQDRLAEAACYAVLRRVAPVLRHDVAGFMQPVGMLMMVLQRRVQMPEPDMPAIAKNVTSVSALAKEATAGCMNAIGWMASGEDTRVSLRSGVDDAVKLLAMELSASGLQITNDLPDDAATIPQSYLRSVLIGAVLAICDQRTAGGTLQISVEAGSGNDHGSSRLMLRVLAGSAASAPAPTDVVSRSRSIGWQDVEAMAGSFGVATTRGEGWLTLGLPKAS